MSNLLYDTIIILLLSDTKYFTHDIVLSIIKGVLSFKSEIGSLLYLCTLICMHSNTAIRHA